MESFTQPQIETVLREASAGWPRIAVGILLGTGMRVGELCALALEDVEDDGDATFLKIKRGKGAKFRRVPVSRQLRRELVRYINRQRPECESERLLVLSDGRPVSVGCVSHLFGRLHHRLGFKVYAHKFRHTFATEYLRRGGEIERLRRILGHTTYVMVMRYVHLDKGDLYRDFETCAPFKPRSMTDGPLMQAVYERARDGSQPVRDFVQTLQPGQHRHFREDTAKPGFPASVTSRSRSAPCPKSEFRNLLAADSSPPCVARRPDGSKEQGRLERVPGGGAWRLNWSDPSHGLLEGGFVMLQMAAAALPRWPMCASGPAVGHLR